MTQLGMPRPQHAAGVTLTQALALLLPFAFVASDNTARHIALLATALAAALLWEAIFAAARKKGISLFGVTPALIVATVVPVEAAIWQIVVAVSLGVILGELVFGGRGFGFLNPATVSLSILVISFPDLSLQAPTRELALATLPGAMVLFALGLVSGRVILSAFLVAVALVGPSSGGAELGMIAAATAYGLVFLIADPTSAASTNVGRWVYGGVAGTLIALFSPTGNITAEAVIFAALLAGIFAPLIDHVVILGHTYRRRRRHHA